eukprot:TRINITY_DN29011_c0_g1_i2.p1 TRINITY_DN29011_c0_g1~~TRINITY_DN29011_c0_g1_i2.p1  ORF type:complete len:180 (+),score=21.61 TRINITY_DN29011_c0_g1_i2:42-542(+)
MDVSATGLYTQHTTSLSRPSHGGYPQPAKWSSWASCSDASNSAAWSAAVGYSPVDAMDCTTGQSVDRSLPKGLVGSDCNRLQKRQWPETFLLTDDTKVGQQILCDREQGAMGEQGLCWNGMVLPTAKRPCYSKVQAGNQSALCSWPEAMSFTGTPWAKRTWTTAFC